MPELLLRTGGNHLLRRLGHIYTYQPVLAVGIEQPLAIGRPLNGADIGVIILRQLAWLSSFGGLQPQLCFASAVADVSHLLPIGTHHSIALVCTRCTGQATGHSLLDRYVKHLTTSRYIDALTIGTEVGRRHAVGHVEQFGTGLQVIGMQGDVNLLALARFGVELIEVASLLKDDDASISRGELHIIVGKVGHLLRLVGTGVVAEEVHRHVAVAGKEDFLTNPHREDVLRHVVGNVGHLLLFGIINPYIIGHATAVVLPGAEFAEHAVVGQLLAIRRIAAEAPFGQRQCLGHALLGRYAPELAYKSIPNTVAEENLLSIGAPGHHHIVGPHAVAQVIASVGLCVGDTQRLTTLCWDGINFGIAVVLSAEGQGTSIGREASKDFIPYVRGQATGLTTRDRHGIEVASK